MFDPPNQYLSEFGGHVTRSCGAPDLPIAGTAEVAGGCGRDRIAWRWRTRTIDLGKEPE